MCGLRSQEIVAASLTLSSRLVVKGMSRCSVSSHDKNKEAASYFGGDRASRSQNVQIPGQGLFEGYVPRVFESRSMRL